MEKTSSSRQTTHKGSKTGFLKISDKLSGAYLTHVEVAIPLKEAVVFDGHGHAIPLSKAAELVVKPQFRVLGTPGTTYPAKQVKRSRNDPFSAMRRVKAEEDRRAKAEIEQQEKAESLRRKKLIAAKLGDPQEHLDFVRNQLALGGFEP